MTWLVEIAKGLREDAREWSVGRVWLWRIPILLYLAYAGVRVAMEPMRGTIFSAITFGIHELGHVVFGFLGEFMGVAGGSLAQLLAPTAVMFIFLRQRDYFGVAAAGAWLSFSMIDLSVYVGDPPTHDLPLLGLTSDPLHDWNYLLSQTGLLAFDTTLAFLMRGAALVNLCASLALGAWLCVRMAKRRTEE